MNDWSRFNAMTPEEKHAAALADPDCQPLTEEDLQRAKIKRTRELLTDRKLAHKSGRLSDAVKTTKEIASLYGLAKKDNQMDEAHEHWWDFPEAWEHPVGTITAVDQKSTTEELVDLRAMVEKLKKALRFYRDATNYELDMDGGDIARKALGEGEYAHHRT